VIELPKMMGRGTLDAAAHGVYRVPELPRDRYDELILARCWAAGRGVISHGPALLVHELWDINPAVVHLTIPMSYRISRAGRDQYELHRADLAETDIMRLDAVVLTAIRRTLADCVGAVRNKR
jgi:predicted transcriptional regulator of viral defense system